MANSETATLIKPGKSNIFFDRGTLFQSAGQAQYVRYDVSHYDCQALDQGATFKIEPDGFHFHISADRDAAKLARIKFRGTLPVNAC